MSGATDDLRAQAVSGVLWTALQKWSVRLSTFVAFLLLGRLLSPEDFGIVALAMTFIVLLTVLADAGFATYLVQARTLTTDAVNTAFYIATGAGIALAVALSLIAAPLGRALDVEELSVVLPALAVSLVFVGLSSVPAALLTRELRFQQLAMRQVLATLVSVVAAVVAAVAGAGVWALVIQTLVRHVVASTVLMAATDFRPTWSFSRREARTMLSYSSKAMSAQMLSQAREQGEALLIGALAGPVALGLWTVAMRLVTVLSDLLGTVVGAVAVPLFARVQADSERLGRAISATGAIGAIVLAPALGALALLSPQVVPAVFGDQWAPATGIASLLAVRGLFAALANLDRSVLLNAGHAGGELRVVAVLTAVHCVLVAAVAPLGIEVLAAVLIAEAVVLAPLRPYLVHRWLGVPLAAYRGVVRVTLAAALSGLITVLALQEFDVEGAAVYGWVVVLGGLSYAGLLLLLARPVVVETVGALRLVKAGRGRATDSTSTAPSTSSAVAAD